MFPITENERRLMAHVSMFGMKGYPIQKVGGRWHWYEAFGVAGAPIAYHTKSAAMGAFEKWMEVYRMRAGAEAYARATSALGTMPEPHADSPDQVAFLRYCGAL